MSSLLATYILVTLCSWFVLSAALVYVICRALQRRRRETLPAEYACARCGSLKSNITYCSHGPCPMEPLDVAFWTDNDPVLYCKYCGDRLFAGDYVAVDRVKRVQGHATCVWPGLICQ